MTERFRVHGRVAIAALLLAAIAALASTAVVAHAAAKDAPAAPAAQPGKPIIDPRADKLLKAMSDYLAAEKQFSVRAEVDFDDVLPTGQKVQYSAVQDIAVRRPDRAYVEYVGDLGSHRLWYDGSKITVLDGVDNVYASAPMPAKLDAALDQLISKHGFSPPLADLLYANPYDLMHRGIQFGLYLGAANVDGVRCHHLAFVDKSVDWQIWIEDGLEIVPRKLVITYKSVPSSPQFQALLSGWDFATRPADALHADAPRKRGRIELVDISKKMDEKK